MKNPTLHLYKAQIDKEDVVFHLYSDDDVPRPGMTSRVLAESILPDIKKLRPQTALDLGCGIGYISLALKKAGIPEVYAADIMPEAIQYAAINSGVNNAPIIIKQSNGFSAFPGMVFDWIIDDVPRVRDDVAQLSSWLPANTPGGGETGSEVTSSIVKAAPRYLSPDGSIYFSISSLSDREKALCAALDTYGGLEQKATRLIPLHKEFAQHIEELLSLQDQGKIELVDRGGNLYWHYDVWRAYDPKD